MVENDKAKHVGRKSHHLSVIYGCLLFRFENHVKFNRFKGQLVGLVVCYQIGSCFFILSFPWIDLINQSRNPPTKHWHFPSPRAGQATMGSELLKGFMLLGLHTDPNLYSCYLLMVGSNIWYTVSSFHMENDFQSPGFSPQEF